MSSQITSSSPHLQLVCCVTLDLGHYLNRLLLLRGDLLEQGKKVGMGGLVGGVCGSKTERLDCGRWVGLMGVACGNKTGSREEGVSCGRGSR